jgi:hypothetical protein
MQSTTKASSERRIRTTRGAESGVALIMALMALLLLTAIGLTLATSTSTEVQVAANYRWSLQALHNAEAGIEVAKTVLVGDKWPTRLAQRTGIPIAPATKGWTPGVPASYSPLPATEGGSRDFENGSAACDPLGAGMGYGVVMRDDNGDGSALENRTHYPPAAPANQYLKGSFTVWYRWALTYDRTDGTVRDMKKDDNSYPSEVMIVVSEGVAPGQATAGTRAVQVVEATIYGPIQSEPCDAGLTPQAGSGPGGAGLNPCQPIGDNITVAVPGSGSSGGAIIDATRQ